MCCLSVEHRQMSERACRTLQRHLHVSQGCFQGLQMPQMHHSSTWLPVRLQRVLGCTGSVSGRSAGGEGRHRAWHRASIALGPSNLQMVHFNFPACRRTGLEKPIGRQSPVCEPAVQLTEAVSVTPLKRLPPSFLASFSPALDWRYRRVQHKLAQVTETHTRLFWRKWVREQNLYMCILLC